MNIGKDDYKLIVAAAFGAIGGLILGFFLWEEGCKKKSISTHLNTEVRI